MVVNKQTCPTTMKPSREHTMANLIAQVSISNGLGVINMKINVENIDLIV